MYAGAVVYAISGIVGLISLVTVAPGSPLDIHALPTPAADGATRAMLIVGAVLSIVAPIALWLWMAWKCAAGRSWARILSTVLFGLATVATLTLGPAGAWGLFGSILSWVIGLGAVILLWQRSSSSYFRAPSPGASWFPPSR